MKKKILRLLNMLGSFSPDKKDSISSEVSTIDNLLPELPVEKVIDRSDLESRKKELLDELIVLYDDEYYSEK